MALIKNNGYAEDPWTFVGDEDALPAEGAVAVSLKRWLEEKDTLVARKTPLGLKLAAGENPEAAAADLSYFDLIALPFTAFKDGRAYSYARILRNRLGYKGELRATGDVLRSQLLFMHRVGFDAFEVDSRITPEVVTLELSRFAHRYQPSADRQPTVIEERHPH